MRRRDSSMDAWRTRLAGGFLQYQRVSVLDAFETRTLPLLVESARRTQLEAFGGPPSDRRRRPRRCARGPPHDLSLIHI